MNTININYMTKSYNTSARSYGAKQGTDKNITDTLLEKMNGISCLEETSGTAYTRKVSAQDMTMEEYKSYIYDKISQLPMNSSRMQDSISINISESGFEAMKKDPEYEKWVLDYLEKDFMAYNPWSSGCGGAYCVKYIGASPEEYRGESWYAGYKNGNGKGLYNEKSENSFWERRVENQKRIKKQFEKQQEKKRLQEEAAEDAAYEKYILQKKLMEQSGRTTLGYTSIDQTVHTTSATNAVASYEANFSISDGNGI